MKLELQAKLLRVLRDRKFERVGGSRTIEVDVRWVAATNRDLTAMIAAGKFREVLYHRLAVFPIRLPPLRERKDDLLPLAEALLARIAAELGRPPMRLDSDAVSRIRSGAWPGNVRELANALERAAILSEGHVVRGTDILVSQAVASHEGSGSPAPSPSSRSTRSGALSPRSEEIAGSRRSGWEWGYERSRRN